MKIVRRNTRHRCRGVRNALGALMLVVAVMATGSSMRAQAPLCNLVQNSQLAATGPNCGSSNLCPGWVSPWIPVSNSPQYSTAVMAAGCGDAGYFQMWGHRTAHEAVDQPLASAMVNGTWYKLRFISRRFLAPPNDPSQPSITRVLGYSAGYPNPVFPTPAVIPGAQLIGEASDFSLACTQHGNTDLPIIQAANNWSRISVDVGNNSVGVGPGDVSWAQVDSITLTPVCCLLNIRTVLSQQPGSDGCCYNIGLQNNVDNISVFGVRATVTTVGFTIASATPPVGLTQTPAVPAGGTTVTWSAPTPMSMGTMIGMLCLNNTTGAPFALVTFEWLDRQGRVICTQRRELKCPPPCVNLLDSKIECIGDSLGLPKYQACVVVQNNCVNPGILSVTPGSGNNISISSISTTSLPGNSSTMVCVTFVDLPALGTDACLRFSINYGQRKCQNCAGESDTICLTLPKPCPCIVVKDPRLVCIGTNPSGISGYQLSMNVTAGPGGTIQIIPSSGTMGAVSPSSVPPTFSGAVTANWLNTGNVTTVCFLVRLVGPNGQVLCETRICLEVTPCPEACACPFKIAIGPPSTATPFASGFVIVSNPITVGSGTVPVLRVRAAIASATITQSCHGQVTTIPIPGTTILAGILPPFTISGTNTNEVTWTNQSCPTLNNTPMALLLRILPPPPPGCTQTVRFCIRYTVTDCKCNTCDTLVCYEFKRKATPIFNVEPIARKQRPIAEKDDATLLGSAAEDRFASIEMTSDTEGTLTINNPMGDSTTEGLTIRTLTMTAQPGVELLSMKPTAGSGWTDAVFTDSGMTSSGTLAPGGSLTFALKFENDIGFKTWLNTLHIAYSVADLPEMTMTADMVLTARPASVRGGDTLFRDMSVGDALKDVRTYALKFTNGNRAGDSIATVIIHTKSPARILAVGPGAESTRAVLQSFRSANTDVLIPASQDERIVVSAIAPGASFGPIYITVAGASGDEITFDYETLTLTGDVVTEGEVTISEPIGAAVPGPGSPDGATTIALSDAVPNPLEHSTTVRFALAAFEPSVHLVLTDATGREIRSVIAGKPLASGDHAVTIDCSDLPAGTYFYTLRTGTQSQTRRMIIVR